MLKFELVDKARKILGLGEEASWREIREKYLELIKKTHPDRKRGEEEIKKINWAYEIIKEYCENYFFSFRKEDVERMDLEGRLREQFGEGDWLGRGW